MKYLIIFLFLLPLNLMSQETSHVYINMAGKVCSETNYSYPLIDGSIIFCENGSYGIKDPGGKILVYDEKYKYGKPLGHGVVLLSTGAKDYLFNRKGEPMPCGDIDLVGQPAIMCVGSDHMKYNAEKYMFGKLLVKKGGKYGLIDTLGNWILNPEYEYLSDDNDQFYYIKKNGKSGLLVKESKQEILTEYEYICAFSDGLAAVRLGKKYGYIDYSGKLVIPLMKATYAGYFIEGVAQIRNEDKNKWIDKRGKEVSVTDRELLEYDNLRLKYDVLANYKNGTSKRPENFIYSRTEGKYLDRGKKFYFYAARSLWIHWYPKDFDNPEAFEPFGGLMNYRGKTVPIDTNLYAWTSKEYPSEIYLCSILRDSTRKGMYVYVDTTGKIVIPEGFYSAGYFDYRGLAKVIKMEDEQKYHQERDQEYKKYLNEKYAKEAAEAKAKEDKEKANAALKNANTPCDKCGGTGYLGAAKKNCSSCNGSGSHRCTVCGGGGRIYSADRTNSQYCTACGGDGKKECYSCMGKGFTVDDNAPVCPACNGTGHK